jgi:hypothetical protein
MSANNGGWKPRKLLSLTCPSGQMVQVRRPGPELGLRSGRVARTFTAISGDATKKKRDDESLEQYYQRFFDELSDEELSALLLFAREMVLAMMVSPKLVLNPNPDKDEIGPDDIGNDFWYLFNYGMTNFVGIKVPVGNAEVEVKDLETFRGESGISGDGVDRPLLPPNTEQPVGDQGLVGSAGA